ncbi:MAG: phospholipid carrier-dependent glycosyltransferase [Nitrospirae bacterium]|nr:phospholipid carrier-dependent glycosyltransferase [Nitrospirota bacterium]
MNRGILFGGVAVLVLAVFYPVIDSFFVTDDMRLIYISSPISSQGITDFFSSSGGWFAGFYRPLIRTAFFVDYSLYNLNPAGYHITNLLFHIASAIIVFYLARLLTGSEKTGAFAAFIFAVQPLHTEAVSWISGRGDVMFTFFYLAALLSFLKFKSDEDGEKPYLVLSVICFILSLLAKESAVTLPVMLFLTEWLYNRRAPDNTRHGIKFAHHAPFVFVLILYALFKYFFIGGGMYDHGIGTITFLRTVYHFFQLFAPVNIDTFRFGNMPGFILNSIIVLNLAVLLFAYLYLCRNKKGALPLFAYCALWLVITSFPLYFVPGVRFLYVSSVASSILMGVILTGLAGAVKERRTKVPAVLVPLLILSIILTSSVRTFQRNGIYDYAGGIAERALAQLKDKHPEFPAGSVLYCINFPQDWVRDTEAWVKPIPVMSMAVKVKYANDSLIVHGAIKGLSTFEEKLEFLEKNSLRKHVEEGRSIYVFEYKDGSVIETTGLFRKEI